VLGVVAKGAGNPGEKIKGYVFLLILAIFSSIVIGERFNRASNHWR